ncbi:MAG TPA: hypothetical protein VL198_15770 [Pseudolabrys sp.]|jgi:hypothetical protein|nr:hypothetical protein [Pseudolabrys sp.]
MRAKNVTLYSLPCVVAVASLLVASYEVAPPASWIAISSAGEHQSGQTINRAAKGDRLRIHQASPKLSPKGRTDRSPGVNRNVVVDPNTA